MNTPLYANPPMVEAYHLIKRYPKVTAVDDVSFAIAPGEIFGLLGHNGAGKTTLIKMLTGQIAPSEGQALLRGQAPNSAPTTLNPIFGIVFEDQNLYERLNAIENLRFNARLYRVPNAEKRIAEVLAQVGLTERARSRVGTYSTGMKQRLCLARAILHRPTILFLDEPSRGLDPASGAEMRALVQQLSAEGTTVLITTHDMEEANQLCHRVAFVSKGRMVALDTPYNLKLKYGQRIIRAVVTDDNGQSTPTLFQLTQPDDTARFAALLGQGRILTAHTGEATLEQVFIALTHDSRPSLSVHGASKLRRRHTAKVKSIMRLYVIRAIILKDALNLLRNRATVLGLLSPLFLSLFLFGMSQLGVQSQLSYLRIRAIATNPDNLPLSQMAGLSKLSFKLELTTTLQASEVYSQLNALDSEYDIGFVMPPSLADTLAKGQHPEVQLYFNADKISPVLQNYVTVNITGSLQTMANIAPPFDVQVTQTNKPSPTPTLEQRTLAEANHATPVPEDAAKTLERKVKQLQDPDNINKIGQGLLIAVSTLLLGLSLAPELLIEEKERHTMRMLLTTPARPLDIIIAKSLLGFIYVAVSSVPVFLFTWSLYKMPLLVVGFAALMCWFGVAVGLILGALFNNIKAVQVWTAFALSLTLFPAIAATFLEGTSLSGVLGWWPSYQMLYGVQAAADGSLTLSTFALRLALSLLYIGLTFWLGASILRRQMRKGG